MRRQVLLIVVFLVTSALTGCATPYQPDTGSGGYRERRIDANTWFVGFRGSPETKIDDVFVYWLYRCAEITVREGYTHFMRIDRRTSGLPERRIMVSNRWSGPVPAVEAAPRVPVKGGGLIFVPIYQGPREPDPEVTGLVRLLREVPDSQKGFVYDAAQILRDHAHRVKSKPAS